MFLHGLMGRGRNFISIARALSEVATSYLVDLPNHGAAEWTDDFSYDQMADSVVATLKTRDVDSAVVVGHSMGGKVAMKVALRHGSCAADGGESGGRASAADGTPLCARSRSSIYRRALRTMKPTKHPSNICWIACLI
ncbi:alpha/beta fold hydrolase [Pseudoglutamicibacter albus]|uniref:alpha/beta fold hydrolase n=1 Tax=Pseudoglutamicibacter albus TaxID=98671 RepID=UPI00360C036D